MPVKSRLMLLADPAGEWGWQEIMLNKSNYLLEVLLWTKSKDAQKKTPSNAPKPFIPEFIKKIEREQKQEMTMTIDDVKDILARPRK